MSRDQRIQRADEIGKWMVFICGASIKQLIQDCHCFIIVVFGVNGAQSNETRGPVASGDNECPFCLSLIDAVPCSVWRYAIQ